MSILRDASAVVIRFAQLEFALTGDLSESQSIADLNETSFSELCLDDQKFINDISGTPYDLSFESWKDFWYGPITTIKKPFEPSIYPKLIMCDVSGEIVFTKGTNPSDISKNSTFVTNFYDDLKSHIFLDLSINQVQDLATNSHIFLLETFSKVKSVHDLMITNNSVLKRKFKSLDLEQVSLLLAERYDTLNTGTNAMTAYNNATQIYEKFNAVINLFNTSSNPLDFKKKIAYMCFSVLFNTKESNIEPIEYLFYFRCSKNATNTMSNFLQGNPKTS